MSALFYAQDYTAENQVMKCDNATVRGNLVVLGSSSHNGGVTAVGDITATGNVTSASFGVTGGKTFTQGALGGTVDASGAGTSRTFQVKTVAMTLAAAASTEFLFIMPTGTLGSSPAYHNVIFSIYDYSGSYSSNGTPIAFVGSIDPTQSRLRIIVKNIAAAQALNGVLTFNITIQRGAAA